MADKKLLIVGVDPGTTVAYAAMDVDGNLIAICSQKELDYSRLIEQLIALGKPLALATDKARVPAFVEKIATKVGARVIAPEEDILVIEKKEIIKGYKTKNNHEDDALAAALFGEKQLQSIIRKVNDVVAVHHKEPLRDKILELVIKEEVSIKSALYLLEHRDEATAIVKKVVEEKKVTQKDFLHLYSRLKELEKTAAALRQHSQHLEAELKQKSSQKPQPRPDERLRQNIIHKDHLLQGLVDKVKLLEKRQAGYEQHMKQLSSFLAKAGQCVVLKKLDNLGSAEFFSKNRVLAIAEGDVVLVDDPTMISNEVINYLHQRNVIAACRKQPSRKVKEQTRLLFIDSNVLDLEEEDLFAIATAASFEKAKQKAMLLTAIVEDYRKSRQP